MGHFEILVAWPAPLSRAGKSSLCWLRGSGRVDVGHFPLPFAELLQVGVVATEGENAPSGQIMLTDVVVQLVMGKEERRVWVNFLGLVEYLIQVLLDDLVVSLSLG